MRYIFRLSYMRRLKYILGMRDVGCICVRRMSDPTLLQSKSCLRHFCFGCSLLWSGVLDAVEVLLFLCHQVKMALQNS